MINPFIISEKVVPEYLTQEGGEADEKMAETAS